MSGCGRVGRHGRNRRGCHPCRTRRDTRRGVGFGVGRKQIANQIQFGRDGAVTFVELQCLVISLARELGVNITQIFMGGGIAWVGLNGKFKGNTRFLELPFGAIKHGQIVVRLRQLRVVLGQRLEGHDGVVGFAKLGLGQTTDEAPDRVFRLGSQVNVHPIQGYLRLPGLEQPVDFLQVGSLRAGAAGSSQQCCRDGDLQVATKAAKPAIAVQKHFDPFP